MLCTVCVQGCDSQLSCGHGIHDDCLCRMALYHSER